ncbi:hypothetical protein [Rhizobium mayense]|uniref:Uncharacterized protein n=1 Tax=Rhizobium mayense TaxID=1312184 RepID=A0ABT7K5J8_9HYPH|nr:hypothetical protein [Rhizobium mayense]MDL2403250.1 hypothetical protein [Rhizobium mayense]
MLDIFTVCRAAHYPKFLRSGVFDEEALLQFDKMQDGRTYAMSVASRLICRTDGNIHKYGRDAADKKNQRFAAAKGRAPTPTTEETYYVGFYEFSYNELISIKMDYYFVECHWEPEHGQVCHYQVEFRRTRDSDVTTTTKIGLQQDRQAATNAIFSLLHGPVRYIDERYEELKDWLEQIELKSALPIARAA